MTDRPGPTQPDEAQLDDARGVVVALMRAVLSDDEAGFDLVLGSFDDDGLRGLIAEAVSIGVQFGQSAYGVEAFVDGLARWQPGCRIGDVP
ncbi:MAG: hypothetical protein U0R80_08005 [Nocardioidaceae bacterium]